MESVYVIFEPPSRCNSWIETHWAEYIHDMHDMYLNEGFDMVHDILWPEFTHALG